MMHWYWRFKDYVKFRLIQFTRQYSVDGVTVCFRCVSEAKANDTLLSEKIGLVGKVKSIRAHKKDEEKLEMALSLAGTAFI